MPNTNQNKFSGGSESVLRAQQKLKEYASEAWDESVSVDVADLTLPEEVRVAAMSDVASLVVVAGARLDAARALAGDPTVGMLFNLWMSNGVSRETARDVVLVSVVGHASLMVVSAAEVPVGSVYVSTLLDMGTRMDLQMSSVMGKSRVEISVNVFPYAAGKSLGDFVGANGRGGVVTAQDRETSGFTVFASSAASIESTGLEYGPGRCYLPVVRAEYRLPVSCWLGPDTSLVTAVETLKWCMLDSFPPCDVRRLAPDHYHIAFHPDGVITQAKTLWAVLNELSWRLPNAKLGADPVEVFWKIMTDQAGVKKPDDPDELVFLALTPASRLDSALKNKKRMLEAIGDAMLTAQVALVVMGEGGNVQAYQERRTSVTSNEWLGARFKASTVRIAARYSAADELGVTFAKVMEGILGAAFQLAGWDAVAAVIKVFAIC